jgi:P27 family predicted phage terminase small subunit
MSRGRKPVPTSIKILSGTRSSRINDREPKPRAGRPIPPDRFDDEAKAEWERLCDELAGLGVLNASHGFALAIYCGAYSRLLIAEKALAQHGALLFGGDEENVVIKSNPAATMAAQCEAVMTRILVEFGLTAASISKVKAKEDKPKDKLAELMSRRNAK